MMNPLFLAVISLFSTSPINAGTKVANNVQFITPLFIGDLTNCTTSETYKMPMSETFLHAFSCVKIDICSNFGEFDVLFSDSVTDLNPSEPLWYNLFWKIGRLFTAKAEKSTSPILKTYCLSPYRSQYVKIQPTLDKQRLFVGLGLQKFDITCVVCLLMGLVLFYQAEKLSSSMFFYYTSGTGAAMFGFVLLAVLLLSRLVPKRRTLFYSTFVLGGVPIMSYFYNTLKKNLLEIVINHYYLVSGYLLVSGFIGFALSYRYGSSIDSKTHKIIQWTMQLLSILLMYNGSQLPQVSLSIIGAVLIHSLVVKVQRNLHVIKSTQSQLINDTSSKFTRIMESCLRVINPSYGQPRFLTEEEYRQQADIETRKALENLRTYCNSPQCSPWKTMASLNSPRKFSSFIEGDDHVSFQERGLHEREESLEDDDSWDEERKGFNNFRSRNGLKFAHLSPSPHHLVPKLNLPSRKGQQQMITSFEEQYLTDDEDLTDDETHGDKQL